MYTSIMPTIALCDIIDVRRWLNLFSFLRYKDCGMMIQKRDSYGTFIHLLCFCFKDRV